MMIEGRKCILKGEKTLNFLIFFFFYNGNSQKFLYYIKIFRMNNS